MDLAEPPEHEENGWIPPAEFEGIRLLRNPVRKRIMSAVELRPRSVRELGEEVGVGTGALYHHLRKLKEAGLVASVRSGHRTVISATGKAPPASRWCKTAQEVAGAIERRPGATHAQLAELSGVDERAVRYHVRRLAEAGLVEVRREGHMRVWPASGRRNRANNASD